jgi:uncharacterized membrane protein
MINTTEKYKFGFLYYDPQDSRVIVPKRIKNFGWTLNFANTWTYVIIVGFLLMAVILQFMK